MEVTVPHDSDAQIGFPEKSFRSTIGALLSALTQSGTTAQRPTTFLWLGRPYWDTTLARVVRVTQLDPVVWTAASLASVKTFDIGTPPAIPANSTQTYTVAVAGLNVDDFVYVNKPFSQVGLGIASARVFSEGVIHIQYMNATAASITPTASETYIVGHIPV